jgi:hypothetical protein
VAKIGKLPMLMPGNMGQASMTTVSNSIIDMVNTGTLETWRAIALAKFLKDVAERVREAVMQDAIADIREPIIQEGVTVRVVEAGTRYCYDNCGHPEYDRLTKKIKELQEKKSQIEAMLRALKSSMNIVDSDTGELVTVYPPSKKSTTTVEVTYNDKKN